MRAYNRAWNAAHLESCRASKRKYRARNPGDWLKNYLRSAEVRCRHIFYGTRCRAKKMGIPFDIEFSDLVWPEVCPVLGIPLDYEIKRRIRKPNSPSIDRTDPTKGYVRGNVVVMSWRANEIKRNSTVKEVEMLLTYMRSVQRES